MTTPPHIPPGNTSSATDASPLDNIIDDSDALDAATDWARAAMLAGRPPEELVAGLVAAGWEQDDAETLVEDVRKATRRERGIVTREDVAAAMRRRRMGTFAWFAFADPILGAIVRLINAMTGLRDLRQLHAKPQPHASAVLPPAPPPAESLDADPSAPAGDSSRGPTGDGNR